MRSCAEVRLLGYCAIVSFAKVHCPMSCGTCEENADGKLAQDAHHERRGLGKCAE